MVKLEEMNKQELLEVITIKDSKIIDLTNEISLLKQIIKELQQN